ncbi:Hypothetical predicted protein [Mytilus galloprovincialis]|uniref:B box-type domain-containing protein n=1 Tax=Mytilus galloprovincialis TaxID=29158 RepID=A0A8B6DA24_MYTGA|nr:Hypothetical predicted protein [Mytilus galloprovincialis]
MASSVKLFCTICYDDGISNRAVTWCTECEVLFCENCEKTHNSKKNHKTMSPEDYQNLPTFMQEKSSQCKDHKKKFELYCSFHACSCCVQCITDEHQKCQDLKPLSDIVKQVKSSASVQLFQKDLQDVKENLDKARRYLEIRIITINNKKTKAVEEILSMRKSINDYLNKLEQDIFKDLEYNHTKLKLDMADIVQQIEQRTSQITHMQSQFTKITQYATDLQMFIGLREIEKTTSEMAKYIGDLERGDHFIEKNLDVNISSALQLIFNDVKSFGDIAINTTSSTLQIKAGRKDQAQHLISKNPEIEDIKPSLLKRLKIHKDMNTLCILACRILPDGKFIILDYFNNQLLLLSNDGIFIRKVFTFTSTPYDSCFVRNNTVAVSLGEVKQTTLVDIEKNRIIQTIKLSHGCFGVASDGETLVISSRNWRCTRINLIDMSYTVLEGMEKVGYISIFQGNIYGIKYCDNKVCCFTSIGEPLWTCHHQDIDQPLGITLDNNGFVYIVSLGKNSIVVVSPDGKTCKTILSAADGINHPYGIDINRKTGIIIVSSFVSVDIKKHKTAFVYQI